MEKPELMRADLARAMWRLFEPVHAVTYFAPGPRAAFEAAGVRGYWRMYFSGRAAPFGPIGPRQAHAAFQSFTLAMVERALPSVWEMISPADAWRVRTLSSAAAVASCTDGVDPDALRSVDRTLRAVVDRLDPVGRPFFAAHLDLDWPSDTHASIWHACTLLREHRGDGYVLACLVNEISGLEMMMLAARAGAIPDDHAVANRGWSEQMVDDCVESMAAKGLLDIDGNPTREAHRRRSEVETMTDGLAGAAWVDASRAELDVVAAVLGVVASRTVELGWLDYPNPVGVEQPDREWGSS